MNLFTLIRVEQTTEEIEDRYEALPTGWTIDALNELHTTVSSVLHENGDHIEDNWSITFGELCRIIQQERAQAKFEADWENWRKMKAVK